MSRWKRFSDTFCFVPICFTVKKEVLHKFAELSIQDRNEVVEKQALKAVAGKVSIV